MSSRRGRSAQSSEQCSLSQCKDPPASIALGPSSDLVVTVRYSEAVLSEFSCWLSVRVSASWLDRSNCRAAAALGSACSSGGSSGLISRLATPPRLLPPSLPLFCVPRSPAFPPRSSSSCILLPEYERDGSARAALIGSAGGAAQRQTKQQLQGDEIGRRRSPPRATDRDLSARLPAAHHDQPLQTIPQHATPPRSHGSAASSSTRPDE